MIKLSLQYFTLWLFFLPLSLAGCGDEIRKPQDLNDSETPIASPPKPVPVPESESQLPSSIVTPVVPPRTNTTRPEPPVPKIAASSSIPLSLDREISSVDFLSIDYVSHSELKLTWKKVANATTYEWCFETPAPIKATQCRAVVPASAAAGSLLTTTINESGALKLHDYEFYIEASNDHDKKQSNPIKLIDYPEVLNQMVGYLKSPIADMRFGFGSAVLLNQDGTQLFVNDETSIRVFEKHDHEWKFLSPAIPTASELDKRLLSISSNDNLLAVLSDKDEVIIYKKSTNNSWNETGSKHLSSLSEINSISLSGNGDHVLVGTEGNGTEIFELITRSMPSKIKHAGALVHGVAFAGSTEQFVVIYEDNNQTKLSLFEGPDPVSDFRFVSYLGQYEVERLSLDFSEDGTTLVIGLPYFNEKSGAVLVYKGDDINELLEAKPAVLTAANMSKNSLFGFSVAVSKDGGKILVGAPYEGSTHAGIYEDGGRATTASGRLADSGAAYLFEERGGFYHQADFIKSPTPRSKEYFGYSVTMEATGEFIAIGAPGESINAEGFNKVELKERSSPLRNSSNQSGAVFLY